MRYCLRKASEHLGVPNPYELSTEHSSSSVSTTEASPAPDWEPLSEPTPVVAEFDPLAVILEDAQKEEQARSGAKISSESNVAGAAEATSTLQATVPSDATPGLEGNTTKPLHSTASASAPSTAHTDEELTMQLDAARLLAQQVTQELVKKPKPTPTLGKASSMHTEDPLLEQPACSPEPDSKMSIKGNPLKQDTAESTEVPESNSKEPRPDESQSKQSGGVFGLFGRFF